MLEQILDLVKQYGQQTVVNNPDVPDQNNTIVMQEAANTITGGLQNVLSGGGLQGILSLFTGNQAQQQNAGVLSNPIVSMMVGHLANNLVGKMNLNPATANAIANNIIPGVLSSLVNNTRSTDPANDNFDLNDLIASFTGGNAAEDNRQTNGFDFQDLVNKFTSNDTQNVSPDLSNVINSITQRSQQQQQQGGLADLIQGFFK